LQECAPVVYYCVGWGAAGGPRRGGVVGGAGGGGGGGGVLFSLWCGGKAEWEGASINNLPSLPIVST